MEGTFDLIGCQAAFLKNVIGKIGSEKIYVGIDGSKAPMYLWNENSAVAMVAPQTVNV